jgi:glycerol-3-phosphate dehydrogenase (NAD(P)+)
MNKVTIIGDGGWGTALAILLYNKGLSPILWSYSEKYAHYLDEQRENTKFLKGIKIPPGIRITSDAAEAKKSEFALFAVPCKFVRSVAERFKGSAFKCVVSATKGIENDTLKRPSEMLADYFEAGHIGALSGPNISFEVAKGFPATAVFASCDNWKKEVQGLLNSEKFRVYASTDIIGVELGGALKNIIAIAAGISDGMGFGANTKASLMTRGLAEMTRLGVEMGAKKETFAGLSGIGDLATTCMSEKSRNHWFGMEVGRGHRAEEVLKETEMVVEGVNTCRSAYELSKKYSVEMPITHRLYEILYENKDPRVAVKELMTRDLKDEDYGEMGIGC